MTEDHLPSPHARALLMVVAVAALLALAWSGTIHQAVLQVFEAAKGIMTGHPVAGPTVFLLLAAMSAMLAFFSSAVLVPAAVYAWGPALSALLLWAGWMLGGLVAYMLAYWLGRPALRWLAPGRSFRRYEERLRREAPFSLVLLFQLAMPSEIPGYVLGLARYPLLRYLAALAIAELPYAVGTMLLGASFVARRLGLILSLGAVAVLALMFLGRALRQRMA